jgi:negative regulator of sigma E activity
MRFIPATALAAALIGTAAYAQDTSSQSGPQNPAVKSTDQNNSSVPVAGANSFTASEAKSRIEAKGYTHVHKLKKGSDGVWRASAVKDGQQTTVSLDYQGNVN